MKKLGFFYQVIHTLFARGGVLILTFCYGVLVARYLGPEGKGVVAMLMVPISLVCTLAESGVRSSTAYYIGKKEYAADYIQSVASSIWCISAPFAFFMVLSVYMSLGYLEDNIRLKLVFSSIAPIIILRKYYGGILLGQQRVTNLNIIEIIEKGGALVSLLILFHVVSKNIYSVSFAYLVGSVFSLLYVVWTVKNYKGIIPRFDWPLIKILFGKGLLYSITLFIVNMCGQIPLILLSVLSVPENVGLYSVAFSVTQMVIQAPLAVGFVIFSKSLAWGGEAENHEKLRKALLVLKGILPLALLGCVAIYLIGVEIVPLVYGAKFEGSTDILGLLLIAVIPKVIFIFLHFYAAGQGKPEIGLKAYLPVLIISIGSGFLLIPFSHAVGAAVAAVTSSWIGCIIYVLLFCKQFRCNFSDVFLYKKEDITQVVSYLKPQLKWK